LAIDRTRPALIAEHPAVIGMPPVFYAIAFVAGLVANWLVPQVIAAPQAIMPIGGAVLTVGALLAVWGKRTMELAGTSVSPLLPAKTLVTTGPFRFTRNPLYLARTLLYVGLALLMDTPWPLLTLVPVVLLIHYGVVLREERYLAAKFGPAYEDYQIRVRRWL
jgi:protein-S-isoprenylcysteine O-methyltransferase Ste14